MLSKKNTKEIGNGIISNIVAAIVIAGLSVLFAYSTIHKLETLMYTAAISWTISVIVLLYIIAKRHVTKLIDKRATQLYENNIISIKEIIAHNHDEQYRINCEDSNRITKLELRIVEENEVLRNRIMEDIKELHLPMNLATAILVQNLSKSIYNDKFMKTRSGLDDFNDNFKELIHGFNIPNKDNNYKEDLIKRYFKILNDFSKKQ